MISNDFQWFSMISTRYHMVGLALPNRIVSLFFGPFCFSCVFWRIPNGFLILCFWIRNPLVYIFVYSCSWFSIISNDVHVFPYMFLVFLKILMIATFPFVHLIFIYFPLFPYMIPHDFNDFLTFPMILHELLSFFFLKIFKYCK